MNWYTLRKAIYVVAGSVVGEVFLALGHYFINTPVDNLLLRQVLWIAGTVAVASVRRKLLPGFLGSQN